MKGLLPGLLLTISASIVLAQPAVLDYRSCQSPVKNQKDRGTCTAFSVAACLETFPGLPADISEQYLYGALKTLDYDSALSVVERGGLLHYYKESLRKFGAFHESLMPYNPAQLDYEYTDPNLVQVIRESQTGPVSMLLKRSSAKAGITSEADVVWADDPGGQDVNLIKKLLQQGVKAVAISYRINVSEFSGLTKKNLHTIVPDSSFMVKDMKKDTSYYFWDARVKYGSGLVDKVKAGDLGIWTPFTLGGHAMTIVGYNTEGFIVKNSWGKNFGDNGYVVISYDYHRLLARRLFAIKKIQYLKPENYRAPDARMDIRLKVIPQPDNAGLSLSLFCVTDKTDPMMATAAYRVYGVKEGKRALLETQTALAPIAGDYNNSFEVKVLAGKMPLTGAASKLTTYEVEVLLPVAGNKPPLKKLYRNIRIQNNEYKAEGAGNL